MLCSDRREKRCRSNSLSGTFRPARYAFHPNGNLFSPRGKYSSSRVSRTRFDNFVLITYVRGLRAYWKTHDNDSFGYIPTWLNARLYAQKENIKKLVSFTFPTLNSKRTCSPRGFLFWQIVSGLFRFFFLTRNRYAYFPHLVYAPIENSANTLDAKFR